MIKSINIVLVFIIFSISLIAQERATTHLGSMTNDSNKFLIRWGDITLGYSLVDKEEILHQDDKAIIIGSHGHPDRLIATFDFDPVVLPSGLKLEFTNLKTVILGGFASEADQEKFHAIPEWLSSLCQIEALVLSNVELSNISVCENLPLKYLDLRKVRYIDGLSVLAAIENLHSLKIFVHDESLSKEVPLIKERLPNVTFAYKGSDKTKQ